MLTQLLLLTCLGAALVGGVFFAFSSFVMKALGQLPSEAGAAAMQRINMVVINPLFLGAFMGTALLAAACVVAAVMIRTEWRALWVLAAGLFYLLGTFGVTMAFNVPRNNRLAGLLPASSQAQAYWPVYLREWSRWNHVRTAAALIAAACALVGQLP
ncbi:anthrone oxygenase family protein [Hydrogenophaga sp. 2FB]|uniref:anthrone oxygenase family protein n=1 Tax=Hydrogenophaga sp. 2FB TaxID=2502187 RepID=UPI0010F7BDDB|nr:anthrone oxygenase family protein [Hydrogenophaga sp. 2FB]